MKKRLLLVAIMSVLLLTGCAHKAKTAEDFKNVAKQNNIEIYDNSVGLGYAKVAYQTNNSDYKMFFVEAKSEKDLQGIYLDEVVNVQSLAGVKPKTTTTNQSGELVTEITKEEDNVKVVTKTGSNWSHVEIEGKEEYFYVSYVDDTMLYLRCKNDYKDLCKKVKDAMKY